MSGINNYTPCRQLIAIAMVLLLVYLTGINFFIYANKASAKESYSLQVETPGPDQAEENTQPAGPDEKTPDRPVSISEEFLHEHQDATTPANEILLHHLLLVYGKVNPVHFDLVTPPPDRA